MNSSNGKDDPDIEKVKEKLTGISENDLIGYALMT